MGQNWFSELPVDCVERVTAELSIHMRQYVFNSPGVDQIEATHVRVPIIRSVSAYIANLHYGPSHALSKAQAYVRKSLEGGNEATLNRALSAVHAVHELVEKAAYVTA